MDDIENPYSFGENNQGNNKEEVQMVECDDSFFEEQQWPEVRVYQV